MFLCVFLRASLCYNHTLSPFPNPKSHISLRLCEPFNSQSPPSVLLQCSPCLRGKKNSLQNQSQILIHFHQSPILPPKTLTLRSQSLILTLQSLILTPLSVIMTYLSVILTLQSLILTLLSYILTPHSVISTLWLFISSPPALHLPPVFSISPWQKTHRQFPLPSINLINPINQLTQLTQLTIQQFHSINVPHTPKMTLRALFES